MLSPWPWYRSASRSSPSESDNDRQISSVFFAIFSLLPLCLATYSKHAASDRKPSLNRSPRLAVPLPQLTCTLHLGHISPSRVKPYIRPAYLGKGSAVWVTLYHQGYITWGTLNCGEAWGGISSRDRSYSGYPTRGLTYVTLLLMYTLLEFFQFIRIGYSHHTRSRRTRHKYAFFYNCQPWRRPQIQYQASADGVAPSSYVPGAVAAWLLRNPMLPRNTGCIIVCGGAYSWLFPMQLGCRKGAEQTPLPLVHALAATCSHNGSKLSFASNLMRARVHNT